MAPEAVLGKPEPDHRADLYALGCVGYWLLTGTLVFDAATSAHMMLQHMDIEPVPPSRQTEGEIPPELDSVILSCLAKRSEDRPPPPGSCRSD